MINGSRASAWILLAFLTTGFVPGGSYNLFNAASGTVTIQAKTIGRPSEKPYRLMRGYGSGGSGDHTKLIWLAVTLPTGRRIVLDEKELDRLKSTSKSPRGIFGGHGEWWIDDSGITFLSSREGNIRSGRFERNNKRPSN